VLDLPGVRELEDCLLLYGNHPGRLEDEVDRVSRQLFGIAYQDTQFDMPDAYWDLPEFSPERIKLDVAFDDYKEQFETGEELADDEAMEALKRLGLDFSDERGQPLRCTKRMSRPAEMAAKGIKGKLPPGVGQARAVGGHVGERPRRIPDKETEERASSMRILAATIFLLSAFGLTISPSVAEQTLLRLDISNIDSVKEVEPAIFEIVVSLQDRSKATLRMNAFTLMALGDQINRVGR
jgi:hypothetical protein